MSASHLPGELGNDQRSRKINKRLVLVLMLSAILILFGSIPLTSLSYWGKSTAPYTSKNECSFTER